MYMSKENRIPNSMYLSFKYNDSMSLKFFNAIVYGLKDGKNKYDIKQRNYK